MHEKEIILNNFMDLYDLQNLVKENTCLSLLKIRHVLTSFLPIAVDLFSVHLLCRLVFQTAIR